MMGDPRATLCLLSLPPIGSAVLSSTPFCGKVEVALRLAGLEYKTGLGDISDKKVVPKGKVHHWNCLQHGSSDKLAFTRGSLQLDP